MAGDRIKPRPAEVGKADAEPAGLSEAKLDSKLRVLVAKTALIDPEFQVDLVVAPQSAQAGEAQAASSLEALGGTLEGLDPSRIQCRVPVGKILDLAGAGWVSNIRLSRRHRMH